MRIKTARKCYIDETLRFPGEVFELVEPLAPLPSWMEETDAPIGRDAEAEIEAAGLIDFTPPDPSVVFAVQKRLEAGG